MDQAGLVVIAMAGLWIAYLVPHRLRYRQQLLEARADDRFSAHLRVIRVASTSQAAATDGRPSERPVRVQLHPTSRRAGRGDGQMDRPHAAGDRVVADAARRVAAARAARAAALAARAAGARRRAALVVVLGLAALVTWAAVGLGSLALPVAAVPTGLLAAVLALGRAAVLAGHRADVRWAADPAALPGRVVARAGGPVVVGRAAHPSDEATEVIVRVPPVGRPSVGARSQALASLAEVTGPQARVAAEAAPVPAPRAGAQVGETWVPVPVPRPAYTLKPAARRAEPAPLPQVAEPTSPVTAGVASPATDDAAARPAGADQDRPTTGGLALDAILARRRAAGE